MLFVTIIVTLVTAIFGSTKTVQAATYTRGEILANSTVIEATARFYEDVVQYYSYALTDVETLVSVHFLYFHLLFLLIYL